MGIYKIWTLKPIEYKWFWNSVVAMRTFGQLSSVMQAAVREHYWGVIAVNNIELMSHPDNPDQFDAFCLFFSLVSLGIAPILGTQRGKWFYIERPNDARSAYLTCAHQEAIVFQVLRDISNDYGVTIEL